MTKKLKIKAVIFDRDGIIINTEGIHIDSIKKSLKQLGFDLQEEDLEHIIGHNSNYLREYFLSKWDFDYDEYRRIQKEIFNASLDRSMFYDSTLKLIKDLYSKKIPIAVTTSASRDNTSLIFGMVEIEELFKVIVTKDDCPLSKPDPLPYSLTAQKLGIDPKYCVAIEDTALGVQSAKSAGMMCIAIPNEYTRDQDFALADAVLESANEVEDLLEFI